MTRKVLCHKDIPSNFCQTLLHDTHIFPFNNPWILWPVRFGGHLMRFSDLSVPSTKSPAKVTDVWLKQSLKYYGHFIRSQRHNSIFLLSLFGHNVTISLFSLSLLRTLAFTDLWTLYSGPNVTIPLFSLSLLRTYGHFIRSQSHNFIVFSLAITDTLFGPNVTIPLFSLSLLRT